MKKVFTTILAIALMTLCFVGCAKEVEVDDSESTIEIEQTANENQTEVGLTLSELTDEQINIFKLTSISFVEDVVSGNMEVEEMDMRQEWVLEDYIAMGDLPANAIDLFKEWKDSVDFHNSLADEIIGAENEDNKIVTNDDVDDSVTENEGVQVQQPASKPKPSESQVKDQVDHAQSKPITPSQNTPKEEVPQQGSVTTASGTADDTVRSDEVAGSGYDRALMAVAQDLAATKGISLEEALAQVKADWGY